jgi:hypothetical protein
MSKRFIILIVAFVFALTNSYRSESKDVIHVPSEVIEQIAPDELHEESPVNSDYGIARQNSFSTPIRNLQPVQKRSGGTSIQKSIIKSGKNLCQQIVSRQYGYVSYYYPSTYTPDRMIIQLRKLVI